MPAATPPLSAEDERRYSRQLSLPEIGLEGQLRLKASSVLIVGAGGLGSPAALYLAAAGVGRIGLADGDAVELSNLQRQVLYRSADEGRPKAEAARERLLALNPSVLVEALPSRVTAAGALELVRDWDVVIDASDNFPTRYALNDACVRSGKPDVFGAVHRFEGQVSVFWAGRGPCYRCLWPAAPAAAEAPNCAEAGVLGVLPGLVGALQALEALKLILGAGETLVGRLLTVDGLGGRFREVAARRRPSCPACGETSRPPELWDGPAEKGYNAAPENPMAPAEESLFTRLYKAVHGVSGVPEMTVEDLKAILDAKENVQLVDVREPSEAEICSIKGATLIPLGQLPERAKELDKNRPIIVHCHHGGRSARATAFLRRSGFEKVANLQGGIDAWAERIDTSMSRY